MAAATISKIQLPQAATAATSHELNDSVRYADADATVVLLAGAEFPENQIPIAKIREAFDRSAELALLWVETADDAFKVELPSDVAAFLPIVGRMPAVAFRRNAPLGEFPDVSEPVRGWLMHAVKHRLHLERLVIPGEGNSGEFDDRLPLLRPPRPRRESYWLREQIERLDLQTLLPQVRLADDGTAFRAGLLQTNDFLDASHRHSQRVEGAGRNAAGDYWHAIMHRREPDYSNAKYWFRRVGSHPIFPQLASPAESLLKEFPQVSEQWRDRLLPGGRWDPFAFVDLCQSCAPSETDPLSRFARRLQWLEMQLLLEQTRQDASG